MTTPSHNPQAEVGNPKSLSPPPLADSPWFYVLVFSVMALVALAVIGPKYGQRQSAMERNYQARTRVSENLASGNNPADERRNDEVADRRSYSTPGDTLVPLWPLATVLGAVALFASYKLYRSRTGSGSPNSGSPAP